MWRRILCAGFLAGGAVCWTVLRIPQFFEPAAGLLFVPILAFRPLAQLGGESAVGFLWFFGILAGAVLVWTGLAVAAVATLIWLIVVGWPGAVSDDAMTRTAAVLSAAFGTLLLLGIWGIQGAEKPPPFDWRVLPYPASLTIGFLLLWPWSDESAT